ncbi:WhiB family transcriptional regulator [Gordonia sp. N1V]|uniref:WhiB family transcriptional regulator n=1 Tax=Gordonia sp. N1V TaxID=3034163 RepID=UPI0023E1BAEB|nr:WhiB family transcriptional regulator [Gordonia sp. N1V]MDF3280853.1 WhiB family transcriptional regulator [Gordonia sp. N1V]
MAIELRRPPRIHEGAGITTSPSESSALSFLSSIEIVPDWTDRAACRENYRPDNDFFFPRKGYSGDRPTARKICDECPVIQQCAAHAIEVLLNGGLVGIWAGEYFAGSGWVREHRMKQVERLYEIAGLEMPDSIHELLRGLPVRSASMSGLQS